MHFAKTYTLLLSNLPPELRENAIQYRQLKKLINQTVRELSELGLSPTVLQQLLDNGENESDIITHRSDGDQSSYEEPEASSNRKRLQHHQPKITYEITSNSGQIEPQLKVWLDRPRELSGSPLKTPDEDITTPPVEAGPADSYETKEYAKPTTSLLWTLQKQSHLITTGGGEWKHGLLPDSDLYSVIKPADYDGAPNEMVIPLTADMMFFKTLVTAIEHLSIHMVTVQSQFLNTLRDLSCTISSTAHPSSSTSSFHPHSALTSKPWSVHNASRIKSDLYSWREIFQLYVEAEVFESVHELDRGERTAEESENRLKIFAERVTQRGLGDKRKLKLKASRDALETFLELNMFILRIKKFQFANAEATRKILKKHYKRTSLPFIESDAAVCALIPRPQSSLPRVLVQAIGEILLPIIPHLEDYSCVICTSIAFKPIRLNCGHLFCVRCLVKMQKRGSGDCPICRAPCVLIADRRNIDWALLNLMQDWFPIESKEKLRQNEKEATREELEELGVDPDQPCIVM